MKGVGCDPDKRVTQKDLAGMLITFTKLTAAFRMSAIPARRLTRGHHAVGRFMKTIGWNPNKRVTDEDLANMVLTIGNHTIKYRMNPMEPKKLHDIMKKVSTVFGNTVYNRGVAHIMNKDKGTAVCSVTSQLEADYADSDLPEDVLDAESTPLHDASKESPEITDNFILRFEPVNMKAIEEALMLVAMRSVSTDNYDCFEILMSIRNRTHDIRRGKGKIAVLEREAKPLGSLQNRLYTGIADLEADKLPREIRTELANGVPRSLAGLSIFAFNKCIRYLCRHGLNMCEVDIVNAVYSVFCEILDVPQILRDFRDKREDIMNSMLKYLEQKSGKQLSRDSVKELFITLGFGGSVWSWMQEHLQEPIELDDEWG